MLNACAYINMSAEMLSLSQNIISYICWEVGGLCLSQESQNWSSVEQGWVTFST